MTNKKIRANRNMTLLRKEVNHMEYKIALGEERFVRFPCAAKLHAGANTKLVFVSDLYPLSELEVIITDGKSAKRSRVTGGCFDLTQYCVRSGVVEIVVNLVLRGTVSKTWQIEPIVVRENGGKYVLIPEIELLRNEVRRMKTAIKELNTKIKDTM